jgi:L-lysine 6-transaminase
MKRIPADKVKATIAEHMLADGYDIALDLRKSRGGTIHDSVTGRDYLDLFSFFASAPLGMNHPELTTPEWITHLGEVAVNNPSNSDFYTEEMALFVKTFAEGLIPASHPHLFFISGGALAVENALKTAFDWKIRKNLAAGRGEVGTKVIHFRNAFHGRSGYTLSLTNTADPRKYMYFPKFEDWPRIDTPRIIFPLEANLDAVRAAETESLAQIDRAIEKHGHDIACLIIEPIQGEGGDNHFRREFFQALRDRADRHDFMLIYDEIQTGMGLTGNWWAWQGIGVPPDIFCFGKKSQVCGIACSNRVDEIPNNVFRESSRINSTWGGNLVDMVRSTAFVNIMTRENTLQNVREQGRTVLEGLHALEARFPGRVTEVRGSGLMCAFDLENGTIRNTLVDTIFKNGAIILPCGTRSVRFRPPLNISSSEVALALELIERSMEEVFA